MKDRKREEYIFISILITSILFIILYFVYTIFLKQYIKIPQCIFYSKFNIYCPGCGCTRAFESMLNGKIIESLYYNPTVIYSTIVLGIYIILNFIYITFNIKKKIIRNEKIFFYIGIILLIVTCIIRNILKIIWNISL